MYRSLAAIVVWLCCSMPLFAQQDSCSYTIKCLVVESHSGRPLFPVSVYIDEMHREFEADEDGRFTIDKACAGVYHIHFHAAGYEHLVQQLNVTANATLKFKLAHTANMLDEVVVTDEHTHTIIQSKDQLKQSDIAANSGKTLGDMLQAVNGVSVISNGATIAKPVIHGLHSNRIVLLNNGIRQEDQQWGGEHAPNIDPFLANNITVLKGAAGVRYGTDAIGGVVLVEPAAVRTNPGWDGEVNLAGFSNNRMGVASAMLQHGFKAVPGLGIRVQGTFKKGGNYRIPGYWVANTGVEENNFSGAIAYKKLHYGAEVFYSRFNTSLGIYRGSHTGNEKDLMAAINSPVPLVQSGFSYDIGRPMQHVTHDLVKAKLYADSKIGHWDLVYAYQHNYRQEYDVMRVNSDKAQLNLTLNTQTLNLNLEHKLGHDITGQAGLDGIYQENFFQTGDRLFIPNYRSAGAAAYLIERYRKNDWMLEGGVRFDYRNYDVYNPEGQNQQVVNYLFDYNSMSGTLAFRQQLKPGWHWSATLSNAWRAPQASELFSAGLHHGAARIEIGDKALKPERSYNLNLETDFDINQKLSADVSIYSQYINDYIYLEPGADILTIRGYFKTFNYRQTDAWLNGVDVSLQYKFNEHLQAHAKGSTVLARNVSKNDWLILMPADRVSLGAKYITNLSKTLQDCYISLDGRYVFEQKRIPANFDSIDYPRPPAAYLLADAEIGTTLQLHKQPLYVSLGVTNLFNTRYRDYLDAFRYFIDQPGRNVVLRVRLPFNF